MKQQYGSRKEFFSCDQYIRLIIILINFIIR